MKKFLKHPGKGTIYNWTADLARVEGLIEVTEEEAFPERFAPAITKGRKAKVDLTTAEIPEPPALKLDDLNAELTARTKV